MSLIEPSYILITYSKSYMALNLVTSNLTFDLNIDLSPLQQGEIMPFFSFYVTDRSLIMKYSKPYMALKLLTLNLTFDLNMDLSPLHQG